MIAMLAVTTLLLSPWKGADLPTTTSTAVKYRLTVKDVPGADVHLRATGIAEGWIAAFCNNKICSPNQIHQTIPASGSAMLQFELIREDDKASKTSGATIESDGGASIVVKAR